jgi:hypothetical protein
VHTRPAIAALFALALTTPASALAARHSGIIDHVADGDTAVLRGGETIRLVQVAPMAATAAHA